MENDASLKTAQPPVARVDLDPSAADRNWRRFVLFRVLFNSRFYYPVLAIFFLDLGLSATQYTLLNFAWALTIVCVDLPAGALADRIGRRPLVVAAGVVMVLEMLLLCLAPRNGGAVLFLCCLANRILSGTAEGMASGADEALVFDSLAERGRSADWARVLDQVMRWQSIGLTIAMLIGGAVYDPGFMQRALSWLGFAVHFEQATTLRFPIYLNLITAVLALIAALGMREPSLRNANADANTPAEAAFKEHPVATVLAAGRWIFRTPLALFVITAGLLADSVVRLLMTFGSSYFRLIALPPATYGLIGAGLGTLGLLVPPIARQMVRKNSVGTNFALVSLLSVAALAGIALQWRVWGILFMIPVGISMGALGYFVSYYLNAIADSSRRATVLSFKGLAFNLGYGFVSLLFAGALRTFRDGTRSPEAIFGQTLFLLPLWLILTFTVLGLAFWRKRALLVNPVAAEGA